MIQPGQKLSEGDYVDNLSIEQRDEIMFISNDDYKWISDPRVIVFDGYILMCEGLDDLITRYNFSDFKQLCENTFGDGK